MASHISSGLRNHVPPQINLDNMPVAPKNATSSAINLSDAVLNMIVSIAMPDPTSLPGGNSEEIDITINLAPQSTDSSASAAPAPASVGDVSALNFSLSMANEILSFQMQMEIDSSAIGQSSSGNNSQTPAADPSVNNAPTPSISPVPTSSVPTSSSADKNAIDADLAAGNKGLDQAGTDQNYAAPRVTWAQQFFNQGITGFADDSSQANAKTALQDATAEQTNIKNDVTNLTNSLNDAQSRLASLPTSDANYAADSNAVTQMRFDLAQANSDLATVSNNVTIASANVASWQTSAAISADLAQTQAGSADSANAAKDSRNEVNGFNNYYSPSAASQLLQQTQKDQAQAQSDVTQITAALDNAKSLLASIPSDSTQLAADTAAVSQITANLGQATANLNQINGNVNSAEQFLADSYGAGDGGGGDGGGGY